MADLEKVIKALELEIQYPQGWACRNECPYYGKTECDCFTQVSKDALELLKEQLPRVLTLEEVTGGGECWIESKNGAYGYCDCYLCEGREAVKVWRCMEQQPSYVPWFTYGKVWRCWTARPTDEQRKSTPWHEPPKEE